MSRFEKELQRWARENENIALNESLHSIQKAQDSSGIAIWIFDWVTTEQAFATSELTNEVMIRIRQQSIQTIAEMQDDTEETDWYKMHAAEVIWHIKDCLRSADLFIDFATKKGQ
jgi:hypothetical protein